MKTLTAFTSLFCLAQAALLVDFNAAKGDDPSVIGLLNLEAARGDKIASNTPDLFFQKGVDWKNTAAAQVHRKEGDIRSEYHALSGKTRAGETYYIGYTFALAEVEKSLMIWQWKEYLANNAADNGANIPLSMEIQDGELQFQFQASGSSKREAQWSAPVQPNTVYTAGIMIDAAASGGCAKLWWNGEAVTFSTTGTQAVVGNTYPGRAEPKFGAYRGEAVEIDTYIYDVQIGNSQADLDGKYF